MAEEGTTLEYTPTWVVAVVCSVIVLISFAVERILHYAGKYFKKHNQKPLFDALQKIKEELMLLGFISLLLTVFQNSISKVCITKEMASKWLPCKQEDSTDNTTTTTHFQNFFSLVPPRGPGRRLLATDHCSAKGKVPLLSITAVDHLHIFIFVLAVAHVSFCALTILFGGAKIRQWKGWEDSIVKDKYDPEEVMKTKFTHVQSHEFIKNRFLGIGKNSALLGWVHSFFKQFYPSVTKSDYVTLRLGFIMTHCRGNPKFNFHKYMIRALEADFKKVVGISWYLWLFVIVFLLLDVHDIHAYFYISFIPFFLLLAVGTKLEHVINQLAHEVAEKHVAVEGDLVVQPSDDHFWFHRPKIVLILVHIILFQNSFELAFFFFIWVQYGFDSCIMGKKAYIIPRLFIGAFVQFLCSYSTLPLYAIVTQMGSFYKKAIFDEHIQEGLVGWAKKARMNKMRKADNGSSQVNHKDDNPVIVQLADLSDKGSAMEEGKAEEIVSELPLLETNGRPHGLT
ncbi:Mlo domain-containing protein [Cephalotus follicularis]|uniref:MLO-like protein n=1 Tax=Cephalotus follicularis TaxID=3775 RepID=A0A1Q3BGQ1_CEPFO|nr:Mlo domain-containing protein [Cephalotus follicularis]